MPKTIMMPEEEYNDELKKSMVQGIVNGRKQIMQAVESILSGNADKLVLADNVETEILDFINMVRNHAGLDALNESKNEVSSDESVATN